MLADVWSDGCCFEMDCCCARGGEDGADKEPLDLATADVKFFCDALDATRLAEMGKSRDERTDGKTADRADELFGI